MQYTSSQAMLIGYSVTAIILSSTLVILRLVSRRLSAAKFWWDDALIIPGLLISYANYIGNMSMVHNGMGRHSNTVSSSQLKFLLKLLYVGNLSYLLIIGSTKTSILLFYLRLFGTPGTRPGFKRLLYTTRVLVFVWLLASVTSGLFRCHPINDVWDPLVVGASDFRDYCIDANAYYISTSAFNVALDFWILVLPLPVVWSLQLSGRRKVGLNVIFLIGGFTCAASIARAYTVANISLDDFSYDATPSVIWSSVELSVGIICACLPTIQPVLQAFSRKIRVATARGHTRRESHGLWYTDSVARVGNQENKPAGEGSYGLLDEELATLRPAHKISERTSKDLNHYGTA